MFAIGDRVLRKSNDQAGFVKDKRPARIEMVEVRWEQCERTEWLPSEELRLWDKSTPPPPPAVTPWGRTTPAYLVEIRRKIFADPARRYEYAKSKQKQIAQMKMADRLVSLSGQKKGRSRNKAKKIIEEYKNGNYIL